MKRSHSTQQLPWHLALLVLAGISLSAQSQGIDAQIKEYQFDQLQQPTTGSVQAGSAITPPALSNFLPKHRADVIVVDEVNYWIYDTWLNYFDDYDRDYDGYYTRFSVEFDADTVFASAPVYAVVYLGYNDRFDAIHVSSVFNIYGDDSSDSFVVDSNLVSGFPPRDYEVLIELYDADTDQLLSSTDGYSDADLAYVSLESENYDSATPDQVIIVKEHGGSMIWSGLLALAGMVVWRRWRLQGRQL